MSRGPVPLLLLLPTAYANQASPNISIALRPLATSTQDSTKFRASAEIGCSSPPEQSPPLASQLLKISRAFRPANGNRPTSIQYVATPNE